MLVPFGLVAGAGRRLLSNELFNRGCVVIRGDFVSELHVGHGDAGKALVYNIGTANLGRGKPRPKSRRVRAGNLQINATAAAARARLIRVDSLATFGAADGLPYLKTEAGTFVEVAVTVGSVTLSQIHPVLDGKNRTLFEPTAFDINSSIQRCLVKAIALHGLGLYVYAGEDLPNGETPAAAPPKVTPIRQERTITPAQLRYLQRLIIEAKSSEEHIKDYFNLERLEDLPMKEFDRALQALRRSA